MKYLLWALLIIAVLILVSTVTARFILANQVKIEVKELYKDTNIQKNEVISKEDLIHIPAPVQKWLNKSGVIGKKKIQTVRLKQKGMMKTDPEKSWMPFTAEQYFNVQEPGFIWYADIQAAPLMHIAGRDKYFDGKGYMLIKIMSLFKVGDAKGKEIDQGAMLRYLAESIWFPTAALNHYITWEEIDETSARATMTYQGVSASGIFIFDQQGDVVSFSAKRYFEKEGSYTLEDWHIKANGYKKFDGIRIPTEGEVTWKLPDGDFRWLKLEISEIEYNQL